ncbi:MAG: hypothetical protein HY543_04885, partial [Deltaproteobacteria bacterium]|nr:hypothetical protein [Deltaproteobacteria bacterium]
MRQPLATALAPIQAGLAAGQAPATLQTAHGPAMAAAVWGMPGGEYAPALDVVRPWTRGVAVDAARFARSVDELLAGCARPSALTAPPVYPPGKRYYVSPRLHSGPAHFDDAGFAVFATPVGSQWVDPLLDHAAVFRSFSQLEALVAGGPVMDVPGLGVRAYAPSGTRLTTLTDLYARLTDNAHQLWLIDRLLYVVPNVSPALATDLQDAAKVGAMTRITALAIEDATTASPAPMLPFVVPAIAREGDGKASLAQILAAVRAYWLSPRAPLDWDALLPMPSLVAWLQGHTAQLHPTDLRRLAQVHRALGHAPGHLRGGQVSAAVDHLVGACAEVALRGDLIETFVKAAATDSTVGLFVEGELATPDGKRISDALLLRLDVERRTAAVRMAWELAAGPRGSATAGSQHTHTLQERLPAFGLILEQHQSTWARVAADTTNTERITCSLDPVAADALRAMAERAIAESLAYFAFHIAVHGIIPTEERRRYRGVRGRAAAGRLWAPIVAQLWATARAQAGPLDLPAVIAQLEARLLHFPKAGRPLIAAELASLHNLAVPLNPDGKRQSAKALARACGVSCPTIWKIQARLSAALAAAGIAIHADPEAARGTGCRAGQTASACIDAMLRTWQNSPARTAQALDNALDNAHADAASDPAVAQFLAAWRNALKNLAVPLNPGGKRQSAKALACT